MAEELQRIGWHLPVDEAAATKLGSRRGKPVILCVDTAAHHPPRHESHARFQHYLRLHWQPCSPSSESAPSIRSPLSPKPTKDSPAHDAAVISVRQ
jgi:hypothetical protein